MNEIIELSLKVRINYEDKKGRKEAIEKAKKSAMSCSILAMNGCRPKSVKLINS